MKLRTKISMLLAFFALSIFVSCTQDQPTDLTVEKTTDISIEDAAKKMEMFRSTPVVLSLVPITYTSALCGDVVSGTHASVGSIDDAGLWDYYSFHGNAGDVVDISVLRTTPGMDPSMTLFYGTTATSDGLTSGGSTNPGMTYLGWWDDQIANPSCFGDPGVTGFALPSTGTYTLAVYDFISCDTPLTYEIHTSGITCDLDGDGCEDDVDPHPNSNMEATVTIDGCDSGAPNMFVEPCSTMSDLIADCAANASTHAEFVDCVKQLATAWRVAGYITGRQNYYLQRCASGSSLP